MSARQACKRIHSRTAFSKTFCCTAASFEFNIVVRTKRECVGRLQYRETELRSLADELVESLTAASRWQDAATVSLQYLSDVDTAVSLLSQAHLWRDALRTAYKHEREDLLETTAIPTAADTASTLLVSGPLHTHLSHLPVSPSLALVV